jgi:hypothetical protein
MLASNHVLTELLYTSVPRRGYQAMMKVVVKRQAHEEFGYEPVMVSKLRNQYDYLNVGP